MVLEKWKINCACCGEDIELYYSQVKSKIKDGKRIFYCSRDCSSKSYRLSKDILDTTEIWTYQCATCNKEVTKYMHEARNKIYTNGVKVHFCSRKCYNDGAKLIHQITITIEEKERLTQMNKEKSREYSKKYYEKNKDKCNEYAKEWYQKNKIETRESRNEKNRLKRQKMRKDCIEHYGNKCECCGETTYEFLTIDHINGGGNQHVKQIKKEMNTNSIYAWLIKHEFPEGFRVLCYNCNCSLGHYGYCPHQKNRILFRYPILE